MAIAVQQMSPMAPGPLLLGVLRRRAVATVSARLIPPPPAPALSPGRGGAALGRALVAGHQALSPVGPRLDDRGLRALRQPGVPRGARPAARVGHRREALWAAPLHKGVRALALHALAGDALPPPWRPPATTPMALSGAEEGEPRRARAPRPA